MNLNVKKSLYNLVECAVFIALSLVLSIIPEIPIGISGGSIGFNMIPLFIICYRLGAKYSFLSGFVFSVLYVLIGGKWSWGLPSVLLDYVAAYTALGVAGLAGGESKLKHKFFEIGIVIACVARYQISVISGVVLYAIAAPTEILGITTASPIIYSAIYNAIYMLPNTVICVLVFLALRPTLKKLDKRS